MTFKKIYLSNIDDRYAVSLTKREGYNTYFTDESGLNFLINNKDRVIRFNELPSPLLRQIK